MTGLDTPFSAALIFLSAVLIAAVLGWTYYRLRKHLRPSHLGMLAGLRGLALVAVLLLLANPYSVEREPDTDGFRVVVLADASGSMETRDVEGGEASRRELVEAWIRNPDTPPFSVLDDNDYRVDRYRFSEDVKPLRGDGLPILAGRTALGDVLDQTLDRVDSERDNLGGVLMISDGHHNFGTSPMEAARRYRDRGIPVTVIGVGAREPPGEVRADFASSRFRGERGEPLDLPVVLSNTRDSESEVTLRLGDDAGTLEERTVALPAGADGVLETFSVTALSAGEHLYRLSVSERNGSSETIRHAFVTAEEPETFSVLYLGSRLNLEYRFIERAVVDSDQIGIEAIIRTGENSFFQALSEENNGLAPAGEFPEDRSFYNRFDAVLVDSRTLGLLSPEAWEALADFASIRGGGLLFFGPLNEVPDSIASALPVLETDSRVVHERIRMELEAAPIFSHLEGGRLFGSPGLFVGEGTAVAVAEEWKRGARPVLLREGRSDALMAAHAFGAGRVAYLGAEDTWQWRMASDAGLEQHRLFWENLLVWLSSAGKPRLTVSSHGERYSLQEPFDLEANVQGSDFRPARDASVSVRITDPSGESWERRLQPSFDVPGRYRASVVPELPGEYHARYRIDFPDGERLERDAYFISTPQGAEREDTRYLEPVLRDLARITGGEFYHYTEVSRFSSLPLSETIPVRESRNYWANHAWFVLLLFAALVGEWFFRRRMGLK